MNMASKVTVAALVIAAMLLVTAPAFAQIGLGAYGLGAGLGCGSCSPCGGVAVGAPQDCIAQVYCNVPVTTNIPVTVPATVPQTVPITVPCADVCPVTIPRAVVVPQTVPVPVIKPAVTATTIPVTVPVQSCVPVTNMVPQSYTVPLGGSCAPAASTCGPCGAGVGLGYGGLGAGYGLGYGLGGYGFGTGYGINNFGINGAFSNFAGFNRAGLGVNNLGMARAGMNMGIPTMGSMPSMASSMARMPAAAKISMANSPVA